MQAIGPWTLLYAQTLIDHSIGWAKAYSLAEKINTAVWKAMAGELFPRHVYPELPITDNGIEFNAESFEEYLTSVAIHYQRLTKYHPQLNGKAERVNWTLKAMLARLVNSHRMTWEDQLGPALAAYRNVPLM